MPTFWNEELDDPYVYEECSSFVGGMVSFAKPSGLQATQAQYLKNASIQILGELRKRRGTRSLDEGRWVAAEGKRIQNLIWYNTTTTDALLAIADGKFYFFNEATETWDLYFNSAITNVDEMVSTAQLSDNLWWTDSTKTGIRRWNGSAVSTVAGSPIATILESYTQRLIASGVSTVPDGIYFSDILDGTVWNVLNILRVGAEGDPIVAIRGWQNTYLLVFKLKSTWLIDVNPTLSVAGMSIWNIHRTIGCAARRSVAQCGQDVFFLSRSGVMAVQKQVATDNNMVPVPMSQNIQDVVYNIRWDYVHKAAGVFYNNHYLLSLPVNSNEPDVTIVYSYLTASWAGIWESSALFSITDVIEQPFFGRTRMIMGSSDGDVRESLDYLTDAEESEDTFVDTGAIVAAATLTSDNFDSYANGASLNVQAGWTGSALLKISKPASLGEVYGTAGDGICFSTATYTEDQYSEITLGTITTGSDRVGVVVNATSQTSCYLALYHQSPTLGNVIYLGKALTSWLGLAQATVTCVAGDVIRLERTGSGSATRLTVKKNAVAVPGLTNINPGATYLTDGAPGVWTSSLVAVGLTRAASWRGGDLSVTYADADIVSVVRTRAMEFGENISPKTGFYIEIELFDRDGVIDVAVILDGGDPILLGTIVFNHMGAILPVMLPFYLGIAKWRRKKFPIWNLGTFRDIQVELTGRSGNMMLRRIMLSAQVDTVELNQELEF